VTRGLRAQLRTANFITGQLYVTLDFFPREKAASVNLARTPVEIPTVPGGYSELQASLEKLVKQLGDVPFDLMVADVRASMERLQGSLSQATQLMGHVDQDIAPDVRATLEQMRLTMERLRDVAPEVHATLEQMRSTLGRAHAVLSDDAPLQGELRTTLRDLARAAETVRSLADYLERHPESLIRGKPRESAR
jgi:paraquat-inducible protein B